MVRKSGLEAKNRPNRPDLGSGYSANFPGSFKRWPNCLIFGACLALELRQSEAERGKTCNKHEIGCI